MIRATRPLLIAAATVGLVVAAIFVIIGASKKTQPVASQPTRPATVSTSKPNPLSPKIGPPGSQQQPRAPSQKTQASNGSGVGSGSAGSSGVNGSSNQNTQAAVQAAAKSVASLASSVFLSGNELAQAVSGVLPSEQATVAQALQQDGNHMACALGYATVQNGRCFPDIQKAFDNAQYYLSVMEYKVASASSTRASIDLYFISYFVTAKGQSYTIPDITVADMVRQNGHWWFKDQRDPPSGTTPANIGGLSTQKIEQLYQNSFLGGYKDYVPQ